MRPESRIFVIKAFFCICWLFLSPNLVTFAHYWINDYGTTVGD